MVAFYQRMPAVWTPTAIRSVAVFDYRCSADAFNRPWHGAAAAAAQLLRHLNAVEDTLTRAEGAASAKPPPKVPAYRLAWRERQAYLAAGDGEAAVAAVLAANHDRTTARLLVALGDVQLSDATRDALLREVASLLGGDYRAYALPYVAAAAKAGALNRVRATTRAELAAGLASAAARGDGDAGYASKLLGRVGLLAT